MSRLRHEIPRSFAETFAWHDVVKIATSPCIRLEHVAIATRSCHAIEAAKSLRISCRSCDIILRLKGAIGLPLVGRQLARSTGEAQSRYGSFCDSGCSLAAKDVTNPQKLRLGR